MSIMLSISSPNLGEEHLQRLTSELCKTITRETDITARLAEGSSNKGAKGDPITLGLIAITFLSSGAAVALFNVLKSYFERDSSMEVNIQRNDGAKLMITAKNMRPDQVEETIGKATHFLEEMEWKN